MRGYVGSVAARGVHAAHFKWAIAVFRLCGQLGLVSGFGGLELEEIMAQSARKNNLPGLRGFVGERHQVTMARAGVSREDWAIVGMAVVSLAFLLRVGEASKLNPAEFRGLGGSARVWYCRLKGGFKRKVGLPLPLVFRWAIWLRTWGLGREGLGEGAPLFSEESLEEGMVTPPPL